MSAALLLVGCGAAPPAEKSEAAPEAEAPRAEAPGNDKDVRIENAIGDIDRAERELQRGVAIGPHPAPSPGTSPVPPTSPSPPGPKSPGPPIEPGATGCETACRALESMRRSAHMLCDLTGDVDARCATASERVKRAETRVREVCGGCDAPAAKLDEAPMSVALRDVAAPLPPGEVGP